MSGDILARFGGFGAVALSIFPDPVTGRYKDAGWQALGDELEIPAHPRGIRFRQADRLQPVLHVARRHAGHAPSASARLGVPPDATVLEPGCGTGNFMAHAPAGQRFIGVELDSISGRIARALHPDADIRIENFRDTKLPPLDAVIGNVPFADVKLDFHGQKLSLHDFFIAKSLDALKPGGVLAVVTSHFTLDKQNAAAREYLAGRADFLGAIRLPSDAFKREGTAVVTDIVFLRKRSPGQAADHADPEWLETSAARHRRCRRAGQPLFPATTPRWSWATGAARTRSTARTASASCQRRPGRAARGRHRAAARSRQVIQSGSRTGPNPPPAFVPPPPERHIAEGSFFVGDDKVIHQVEGGQGVPVVYGGTLLKADGTMTGKRLAALIGLRDLARRVLQSQNEGWPEANRQDARRKLNLAYDRFAAAYGPINKTTFSETADGTRHPPHAQSREIPRGPGRHAGDGPGGVRRGDRQGGQGPDPAAGRGRQDAARHARSPPPRKGCWSASTAPAASTCRIIARLYGKPEDAIIAELGDLIYRDPATKHWQTADEYLSGNVRAKLATAEAAGPAYARNAEALRARAARGRAARRHRRRPRCPVDTGERHPGVRRRAVRRRPVGHHRSAT